VELLTRLEELVRVIQRRGIDFADFLSRRDNSGRLPLYRIVVEGEEQFFHSTTQRDDFLKENKLFVEDEEMPEGQPGAAAVAAPGTVPTPIAAASTNGNGNGKHDPLRRLQKTQELHEVRDMEKLFSQLEAYGLSIDDYFLTQEESVSGEKLATKYALVNEEHLHNVAGVAQLL